MPASFARVAAHGEGWVGPSFGLQTLTDGIAAVREAWRAAGRRGRPRIVAERYFCLGDDADEAADHYLMHYYTSAYFSYARQDTLTSRERIRAEIDRLAEVGCDDLLLLPCSPELSQVGLLADAVGDRPGLLKSA